MPRMQTGEELHWCQMEDSSAEQGEKFIALLNKKIAKRIIEIEMIIHPKEISVARLHAYMLASIQPRPIAFASTVDSKGNPNLSPFSFFNAFGSNPPTLIFSPARRVRDNST